VKYVNLLVACRLIHECVGLQLALSQAVRYTDIMTKKNTKKTLKAAVKAAEFEPNKMGFAVAALAAVSLVILGLVAMNN
jgi:hypothetical protein